MTTEERTRHEVLLEKLENDIRVIGEAHAGNTELLHATRAELERRIEEVDRRVIVLDVKVHRKIEALDEKIDALDRKLTRKLDTKIGTVDRKIGTVDRKIGTVDRKIGTVDRKVDRKFDAMSAQLSRIAKHLGLDGAPHQARRR